MTTSASVRSVEFRPARMQDIEALASFVEKACAEHRVAEDAAFALRLAVEEAFTNIVQHGYGAAEGPVYISFDGGPDRITISIRDEAPRFDPADAPAANLSTDLDEREPGGLGWYLVEQMMDDVQWAPAGDTGNIVTLIKELADTRSDRKESR